MKLYLYFHINWVTKKIIILFFYLIEFHKKNLLKLEIGIGHTLFYFILFIERI